MKKFNPTITLSLALLTTLLIVGCGGKKDPGDNFNPDLGFRTIVLQVNTAEIKPPKNDLDQYCSFPGQLQGVPASVFTTGVAAGDKILWVGVSTSAPLEDIVSIDHINNRGGKRFLKNLVKGENGMVIGTISDLSDTVSVGDEEEYAIKFTVKRLNGQSRSYVLDPKLQILN
jgi:hypothetical protein